VKYSAKIS